jgi:dienelactone hydrolase
VGERYREFSPAHHVTKDAPPTIVFLGDKDKLIPVRVLEDFKAKMQAVKAHCESRVFPGAGHGFFNRDADGIPGFSETLAEADRFHLARVAAETSRKTSGAMSRRRHPCPHRHGET